MAEYCYCRTYSPLQACNWVPASVRIIVVKRYWCVNWNRSRRLRAFWSVDRFASSYHPSWIIHRSFIVVSSLAELKQKTLNFRLCNAVLIECPYNTDYGLIYRRKNNNVLYLQRDTDAARHEKSDRRQLTKVGDDVGDDERIAISSELQFLNRKKSQKWSSTSGQWWIANRAIICLDSCCVSNSCPIYSPSIPNLFFLTFFIYNHRNLAQFLNRICTILPTSEVAEVAIIRVITYYYAMVYPMTADEEPHLVY